MKYDEILVAIGGFGPYQQKVLGLLVLPCILSAFISLISVFTTSIPEHRCKVPRYPGDTYNIQSPLHNHIVDLAIPEGGQETDGPYNECYIYSDYDNITLAVNSSRQGIYSVYEDDNLVVNSSRRYHPASNVTGSVNGSGQRTVLCTEWVYDTSDFDSTMMTEFDLICDRKIYRSHSHSAQFFGGMIGSIFMGLLADVFGRKKAILASILLNCIAALGIYLAPQFIAIIAIRVAAGIAGHSLFAIGATTAIEFVGPEKRSLAGIVPEFLWCLGAYLLIPLAYFIRAWRDKMLAIAIASIPFLGLWWFIPESPRWLLDLGKFQEAEKVLENICISNKTKLPHGALDEKTTDEGPHIKMWKLFTHRVLIVRYLILFFNWLAINSLYYGLSLNVDNLAGSIYVNFFISNSMEVIAYIACLFVMDKTGRRKLHCISMFTGGIACLAVIFPVTFGTSDHEWITTALSMIGKMCASTSYALVYIMSSELFPTPMRNSGIGFCSIFENVGGTTSPYIADLGIIIGGPFAKAIPMIAFGILSILAGFFSLLLPETLHRKLPETIQDAIDFGKDEIGSTKNGVDGLEANAMVPLTSADC